MTKKINQQIKVTELGLIFLALLAIFVLECIALMKGVDGVMFGSSMATIGGICGYLIKAFIKNHHK